MHTSIMSFELRAFELSVREWSGYSLSMPNIFISGANRRAPWSTDERKRFIRRSALQLPLVMSKQSLAC